MKGKFVSYIRVSTARQGRSGLGMEAQQQAVEDILNNDGCELVAEYVEVESGKRHENRPQLKAAIEACRKHKAKLIIAKMDRLARNVAFISNLMESDVEFVAADMPNANRLTIHILAAVAEHERQCISDRTRAALQVAKAKGVRLGNPRLEDARRKAVKGVHKKADLHLQEVMPHVKDIRTAGIETYAGIAKELTSRGIKTSGRRNATTRWSATQVYQLLKRTERRPKS